MQEKKSKNILDGIDLVYVLKEELGQKILNGDLFDAVEKAQISKIKSDSLIAIKNIVDFCKKEYTHTHNPVIKGIKKELTENFSMHDPDKVTVSLLKTVVPVLERLEQYVNEDSINDTPQTKGQNKEWNDYRKDIVLINEQLMNLKELLHYETLVFTPQNVGMYMKASLYRDLAPEAIFAISEELAELTQKDIFDIMINANEGRIRIISFLNQLKNIFQDKKQKIEAISGKKISSSKKAPIDKSLKRYYGTPVVNDSLIPTKQKTAEDYLHEADQDFSVGGIELLKRARIRYEYILKNFFEHNKTEYIENQIKRITKQLVYIIENPPLQYPVF
jgi:hypothetical protein